MLSRSVEIWNDLWVEEHGLVGEKNLFEFMEMMLSALEAERQQLRRQSSPFRDLPFPGHTAGRLLLYLPIPAWSVPYSVGCPQGSGTFRQLQHSAVRLQWETTSHYSVPCLNPNSTVFHFDFYRSWIYEAHGLLFWNFYVWLNCVIIGTRPS